VGPDGLPGGPVGLGSDGILSVREITAYLKHLLDRDELLQKVIVRGEISNLTRAASGHLYFSLKDESSQLGCVFFRGAASGLRFDPKDGDRVVVGGSISVYERGGKYQLVVRFMRPDGVGDLAAAFELLKAQLETEGLFDPSRKRELPRFPKAVAVCTSPTGAAVRDITSILARRYPPARVVVIPTVVQGDEACASIVRSLQIADGMDDVDVIIVGRGGGSIEDLWAFNLEPVARAIFACRKPVVSAVGHETDFTLADFVADVRAATPSMAAEMVTPDSRELLAGLGVIARRLKAALRGQFERKQARFLALAGHPLLQRPRALLEQREQRLDEAIREVERAQRARLERLGHRVERVSVALAALNPTAVVQRGYAICRLPDGSLVRRLADAPPGQDIEVMVGDGDLLGTVRGHRPAGG